MKSRTLDLSETKVARFLAYIFAGVFVLLPFHAFFTTWLGSNFGHLDLFRIWKEIIIIACLPVGVWLFVKTPHYKEWLRQNWLPRLIIVYVILSVLLGLLALGRHKVTSSALIYGLFSNLRFLGFFLFVALISSRTKRLRLWWPRLVFGPAAVVLVFGLLQRVALPLNFLSHFGYGPQTIPAYQTVDNKLSYQRIQSTLRGANPLGAYLVAIAGLCAAHFRRQKQWLVGGLVVLAAVVFLSYSRSAYVGCVLTVAVAFMAVSLKQWRVPLIVLASLVVLTGAGIGLFRHNTVVQNTLFHTDNTSRSTKSSNADRAGALEVGVRDVLHEPLGRGPGSAGPASTRNNSLIRFAENYYLQIGQETGWFGLGLFVAITSLAAWQLWQRRNDTLALGLLASLVGLTFVNMLSHAWADDTLGLLWWGLAGIALSPGILKPRHKHHETPAQDS